MKKLFVCFAVAAASAGFAMAPSSAQERAAAPAAAGTHQVGLNVLTAIIDSVPEELLMDPVTGDESADVATARARYVHYLRSRRAASPVFVAAALEARDTLRASPTLPYSSRR